jgi:hypothetical protein
MITVGIALRGCNVAVWAAAVGHYLPSTPPSRCDQGRRQQQQQQQENRARHFKSHMSLACPPHFSMQLVLSQRFNTADRHCRYRAQRRKTSSSAGSGKGIDDEVVRSTWPFDCICKTGEIWFVRFYTWWPSRTVMMQRIAHEQDGSETCADSLIPVSGACKVRPPVVGGLVVQPNGRQDGECHTALGNAAEWSLSSCRKLGCCRRCGTK